jgi:signal transduction histidine kinase
MDPEQAIQIFLNQAANARDAMPAGGLLTFRTHRVSVRETPEFARITGPAVLLSVVDTGAGMDERTREHVFEPFFTTKEPGRGTGSRTIYRSTESCNKAEGGSILRASPEEGPRSIYIFLA